MVDKKAVQRVDMTAVQMVDQKAVRLVEKMGATSADLLVVSMAVHWVA
jgi:hypothetical protein